MARFARPTRRLLFVCALLASCVRADAAVSRPTPARTSVCDDGVPLPDGFECAPVLSALDSACPGEEQVMALLHGCYYCVSKATCLLSMGLPPNQEQPSATPVPSAVIPHSKGVANSVAMATASKSMRTVGEGAQPAEATLTRVESAGGGGSRLSNAAFLAPVAALAFVGVGVATRKVHEIRSGRQFERLEEEATDEINPFCVGSLDPDSDEGELELEVEDEEQKEGESSDEDREGNAWRVDDGSEVVATRPVVDSAEGDDEDEPCL